MGTSASIHELVLGTLAKLGVPAPATVIQTMLMKDGYFVGHKLRYDGGPMQSIWRAATPSSSTTSRERC